jgi:hypothetical protein
VPQSLSNQRAGKRPFHKIAQTPVFFSILPNAGDSIRTPRLAQCFDTTGEFWLNLQTRYHPETARDKAQRRVKRVVRRIPRRVLAGA